MFRNYINIAFRNLWKNKAFSMINIIGLSLGLSASFVIVAMIYYDLTFDKFHEDGDRIYRATSEFIQPEGNFYNHGVSIPLGEALRESVSGVETVSTFFTTYFLKVQNKDSDKTYRNIDDIIFADKNYFELFKYNWLAGTPDGAFENPNEVVLTESRAAKYFPDLSPMQVMEKTVFYNDSIPAKVVGIVADFEERSDLGFNEFLSRKTAEHTEMKDQIYNNEWNGTSSSTQVFLKIGDNRNLSNVQAQLDALAKEHTDNDMIAFNQQRKFHLQPLADIHFNTDYGAFDNTRIQASKSVLISLAFIALFLLLLGCINFINLNTAQATRRAKEIGIRKTLGSSKKQLVFQFLGETFLLTCCAAVVSLLLSSWLLRLFADFMPAGVGFALFKNPELIVSIIVLLLVLTLLSGFYPALVLSHFKPVSALKNQVLPGNDKGSLRKYLTVFQFVVAQIFIIATLLVGKQIHFLMTQDMGFKTDAIAYVRTPYSDPSFDKRLRLMDEIKTIPQIADATLGGNPPASNSTRSRRVTYRDGEKEVQADLQLLSGDSEYFNLYDLKLIAGRMPLNDTIREYVINQSCMKQLGFNAPKEAINKMVGSGDTAYPIVGVMEDFNQRSLRTSVKPMALVGDWDRHNYSNFNTVHISLGGSASDWGNSMAKIEDAWKDVYPDFEFDPKFIDQTIEQFYQQERKTSVLLKWATGLAILISCLGLLGLVIHTTERRTKEIGIRKVLGASLAQLSLLFCKEFLILVGIAFVLATPIAWWGTTQWLQDFAYKTDLSWWIFALNGIAMLLIALFIVSFRTIATASRNPVKSLKTE